MKPSPFANYPMRAKATCVNGRGPSCYAYERDRYVRGRKQRALWLRRDGHDRDDAPLRGGGERRVRDAPPPRDDVRWTDVLPFP